MGPAADANAAPGVGVTAAISRVVNTRSVGPGLLVIGGSLIALAVARSRRAPRLVGG